MNHSHKENIEIVRRACVAANPEIDTGETVSSRGAAIRLADVLLAIGKERRKSEYYIEVGSGRFIKSELLSHDTSRDTDTGIYWNLRNDDLTAQSPETIQFLATLLLN